ncbi:MAG: hypothetical protein ACOXZ4_05435 [Sphaerochaetaceae bacterium]
MKIRKLLLLLVMCGLVGTVGAKESTIVGNIKLTGSTSPELKVEAGYTVTSPIWGSGPLFEGNNVKLKGVLGVSPVAATLSFDGILTPIAVAEIALGGSVGTGWNFFSTDMQGLRIGDGVAAAESHSMQGIYYEGRASATLQFDTAAIWPGEWNHVVLKTTHQLSYKGYTAAPNSPDGWEYETGGLHQNGLNYKGDYVIGYQMPLMLNMVAVLVETYLENIDNDFAVPSLTFDLGLVANLNIAKQLSLTLIPQFTTRYIDSDSRKISKGELGFKRVAAMLNYTF